MIEDVVRQEVSAGGRGGYQRCVCGPWGSSLEDPWGRFGARETDRLWGDSGGRGRGNGGFKGFVVRQLVSTNISRESLAEYLFSKFPIIQFKQSLWLQRFYLRRYDLNSIYSFMFPRYYLTPNLSVPEKKRKPYHIPGPILWQLQMFLAMSVQFVSFGHLIFWWINRKRDWKYNNLPSCSYAGSSSAFDEAGKASSSRLWWYPSKVVTALSVSIGTFRLLSAINVCHLIRLSARDHIRLSKVSSKDSISDNDRKQTC